MNTEIGAMVSIVNGLLNIVASGGKLFGGADSKTKQELSKLQQRFAGLAKQIELCEQLDRLIPLWERRVHFFDDYVEKPTLSKDEAREIKVELNDLMRGASDDYFSGAFFATQYDVVPAVHAEIGKFRIIVQDIKNEIGHIPPGAWSAHWAQLASRLRDLVRATNKVRDALQETMGALLRELRDASLQKAV